MKAMRMLALAFAAGMASAVQAAGEVESLCAMVNIKIEQTMTLERQAFEATMEIANGMDNNHLSNVWVAVKFSYDNAGEEPALASSDPNEEDEVQFYCRVDDYEGLTCQTNGMAVTNGLIPAQGTGVLRWLIIPTVNSGGTEPGGKLYYVGATLSYEVEGEVTVEEVTPDFIFVRPLPKLELDYFLPGWVYGDDPWTADVREPSVPFPLGVRVMNAGYGTANKLKIESAQPTITENKQLLDVQFRLLGASVQGSEVAPTLTVDFGTLGAESVKVAHWEMEVTMCGYFQDFAATYTHADELGGELTSLIQGLRTHQLVKDVLVDHPGRDRVRDFLAVDQIENEDVYRVYESEGLDPLPVTHVKGMPSWLRGPTASNGRLHWDLDLEGVKAAAQAAGAGGTDALYVKIEGVGGYRVVSAIRSDGKVMDGANVWVSKWRENGLHPWQYDLHLFNSDGWWDLEGVTNLVITVEEWVDGNTAPEIGRIVDESAELAGGGQTTVQRIGSVPLQCLQYGERCEFTVQALDRETQPEVSLYFAPREATFETTGMYAADLASVNGEIVSTQRWSVTEGTFRWTAPNCTTSCPVQFIANDGTNETGTTVWMYVMDGASWTNRQEGGNEWKTNFAASVTITNVLATTAGGDTAQVDWYACKDRFYDLYELGADSGVVVAGRRARTFARRLSEDGHAWTYAKGNWPGADRFEQMTANLPNRARRYYRMVFIGDGPEDEPYLQPGTMWGVIREGTAGEWTPMEAPVRVDRRLNRARQDYYVSQGGDSVLATNTILGEALAEGLRGEHATGTGTGNPEIYFQAEDADGWYWQGLYLGPDGMWHADGETSEEECYGWTLPEGKAFWLHLPEGTMQELTFSGAVGNDGAKSIEVKPGWNLIGLSEGLDLPLDEAFAGVATAGSSEEDADLLYAQTGNGQWRKLMYVTGEGEEENGHWVELTANGAEPPTDEYLRPGQAYYYLRRSDSPAELRY